MRTTYIVIFLYVFTSCKNETKKTIVQKEEVKDSVQKETPVLTDSLEVKDSSFVDFMELFFQNMDFQKSRVDFPVNQFGISTESDKWLGIEQLVSNEFYPYLIPDTLDLRKVNLLDGNQSVTIVDFNQNTFTNYTFSKISNQWKLKSIEDSTLDSLPENNFLTFITEFSSDADFQKSHIAFPLKDISWQFEEDGYKKIISQITVDEWEFFELSKEIKFLIIIDNLSKINTDNRYIYLNGNDNGINIHYRFEKREGEWYFTQIEDLSN